MVEANPLTPFPDLLASKREAPWRRTLEEVVRGLRHSREVSHNIRHQGRIRQLPSREAVQTVLNKTAAVLFPTHYGAADLRPEMVDAFVDYTLVEALMTLEEQVRKDLQGSPDSDHLHNADVEARVGTIVQHFAAQLTSIRNLVVSDLMAAYKGDPAARSYPEIMLSHPGILALLHYRIARPLYLLGATLVARLMTQIAHSKTAIDIHPGARIGQSFYIDRGTGLVIGETAIIGDRVSMQRSVTLAAGTTAQTGTGRFVNGEQRHPIIEDDVIIQAGATVVGPVTVGRHSVIGSNTWLATSVPPNSTIAPPGQNDGPLGGNVLLTKGSSASPGFL